MHNDLISFAKTFVNEKKIDSRLTSEQCEALLACLIGDLTGLERREDKIEVAKCLDGLINTSALNQALIRHSVLPEGAKVEKKATMENRYI